MIVIPPPQQQGATPQKGDSKKGGATTTLTAFGLVLPIDQQSKKNNTTTTPNAQDRTANRRIQPSRNNSPRSQMDFDIQATQQSSDDEYSTKLNHSHDAFEIQHKTQAMRDLDVLLGDNNDNDDEEEEEEEQKKEKEETSKKSQRRQHTNSRSKKKSSPRHSKWLFQYTSDDIDEAVEDLISPFDGITNFMTCHRCEGGGDDDDDDSIVDENDSIVAKGEMA